MAGEIDRVVFTEDGGLHINLLHDDYPEAKFLKGVQATAALFGLSENVVVLHRESDEFGRGFSANGVQIERPAKVFERLLAIEESLQILDDPPTLFRSAWLDLGCHVAENPIQAGVNTRHQPGDPEAIPVAKRLLALLKDRGVTMFVAHTRVLRLSRPYRDDVGAQQYFTSNKFFAFSGDLSVPISSDRNGGFSMAELYRVTKELPGSFATLPTFETNSVRSAPSAQPPKQLITPASNHLII